MIRSERFSGEYNMEFKHTKQKKKSFNIFLHKSSVKEFEDCLTDDIDIQYEISTIKELGFEGKVFIANSESLNQPSWVNDLNQLVESPITVPGSITRRVLLIIKLEEHFFGITYGYGRYLINMDTVVKDFGIRVAVNTLDSNKLSKLSLINIGDSTLINSNTEPINPTDIGSLGIDSNRSIFRNISGISKENFDVFLSGTQSLSIRGKFDITKIDDLLRNSLINYKKNDYLDNGFEWIDYIQMITDNDKIKNLNSILVENFKKGNDDIYFQVNDLEIDFDVEGYFISGTGKRKETLISYPLNYEYYLEYIKKIASEKEEDEVIKILKQNKIVGVSDEGGTENLGNSYKGILFETEYLNDKYILFEGQWYELNADYYSELERDINQIALSKVKVPKLRIQKKTGENKQKRELEENFNSRFLSLSDEYILMDRELFYSSSYGNQSIEACDIYDKAFNSFIHVKLENSSSLLSHLFFQGYTSALLFRENSEFKKFVFKKINQNESHSDIQYQVVFAIPIKNNKNIYESIPFFSKVALNDTVKRITRMGYQVLLLPIEKDYVDNLEIDSTKSES